MADQTLKKAIFTKSTLPNVSLDNEYSVRFRIVSEDRNRTSAWSQVFSVTANDIQTVDGRVSVLSQIVSLVWQPQVGQSQYDVFVSEDSGEFAHKGEVSATSYSFLTSATESIDVIVQVASSVKAISEPLQVYVDQYIIN